MLQHLWETQVGQFATITVLGGGRWVGYLAEEERKEGGPGLPFVLSFVCNSFVSPLLWFYIPFLLAAMGSRGWEAPL